MAAEDLGAAGDAANAEMESNIAKAQERINVWTAIQDLSAKLKSLMQKQAIETKQANMRCRLGDALQPLVDALAKKWNKMFGAFFSKISKCGWNNPSI